AHLEVLVVAARAEEVARLARADDDAVLDLPVAAVGDLPAVEVLAVPERRPALGLGLREFREHAHVADRDLGVVALDHERSGGRPARAAAGGGGAGAPPRLPDAARRRRARAGGACPGFSGRPGRGGGVEPRRPPRPPPPPRGGR